MEKKDLYSILGVDKKATDDEIKKAYRKLAIKYHPDRNGEKSEKEKKEAEAKFKEIAEAYDVLRDKTKRQAYDMFGTTDGSFGSRGGSAFDEDEIFRDFMRQHGFRDGTQDSYNLRGEDKKVRVHITLEELYNGGNKEVKFKKYVRCTECGGSGSKSGKSCECPHCKGTGIITNTRVHQYGIERTQYPCPHCQGTGVIIEDACPHCKGQGRVEEEQTMNIPIPSVDKIGYAYKYSMEGNASVRMQGDNGDLIVVFALREDENFKIDPQNPIDLVTEVEVPVITMITGGEIVVNTLSGDRKCRIKECCPEGAMYRLSNYGLPLSNGVRGSLYVKVRAKMPTELNDDERKLLEKLKGSKNFK